MRFIDESDNWNLFKLGEVLDKKGYIRGPFGSALKRGEMKKEGIPVYEQQHAIYNNRIFRYYIDNDKFQELKRFQVFPNDLIVSCSGTIGKTSLITNNDEKGIISQALLILRSNPNIINPKFLKYFLETNSGYNSLISSAGGSSQVNIAKKQIILDIPLLVPNLETQSKIISFLDLINNKIELLEEKHKYYQDFKKYLMQKLFAQELRFDDNCHYKTKKVKDFLTESKIEGTDDINKRLTVKLNLKGITVRESKTIEKEGATKQFIRKSGQFIYGKQNLHKGAFGIVPKELDGYLSSSDIPSFDFKGEIEPKWFYYYFSRKSFYESLESLSTGTGSKRISPKEFLNIKLIVPELKEQHRIVCLFAKVDEEINGISNQILQMNRFKKSLLQQMFVVRINWRCNFKLAKSPSFNKHLLILKNKIIFIIIK